MQKGTDNFFFYLVKIKNICDINIMRQTVHALIIHKKSYKDSGKEKKSWPLWNVVEIELQNRTKLMNIHKINVRCSPECYTSFSPKFLPVKLRRWTVSSGGHFFIFIILCDYISNIPATHESYLLTNNNVSFFFY